MKKRPYRRVNLKKVSAKFEFIFICRLYFIQQFTMEQGVR
jgi:hypothetical protein